MKALSIRQPWAWAIIHAGKPVENRDWQPRNPGLRFRGQFLIHASLGMTGREYADFVEFYRSIGGHLEVPSITGLRRGGIVGRARVVDTVGSHYSPWFFGPLALVLTDVKSATFVPLKGALGFFDVPDSVVAEAVEA